MAILTTTHNAGFFSNCTIRLRDIINYVNIYKSEPDSVDSSAQWAWYKNEDIDLTSLYFKDNDIDIPTHEYAIELPHGEKDWQYEDYRNLPIIDWRPFVLKYYSVSEYVQMIIRKMIYKYNIEFINSCCVFFRGNDKVTETKIADYDKFIDKAKEIDSKSKVIFYVIPDECEFAKIFKEQFPNSIILEETPCIPSASNSNVFSSIDKKDRPYHGANYLASVYLTSHMKYIITHSGNGAMWQVLFRGNSKNIHQFYNNDWY